MREAAQREKVLEETKDSLEAEDQKLVGAQIHAARDPSAFLLREYPQVADASPPAGLELRPQLHQLQLYQTPHTHISSIQDHDHTLLAVPTYTPIHKIIQVAEPPRCRASTSATTTETSLSTPKAFRCPRPHRRERPSLAACTMAALSSRPTPEPPAGP